jgi:hypothetical protein
LTHIYWTGAAGIGREPLDAPDAYPATIVPQTAGACGIAVDQSHLYWANADAGTIGRANLDGSDANPGFLSGLHRPCAVAVGGDELYWVERDDAIRRSALDGSNLESVVSLPAWSIGACGIALDDAYLYWSSLGEIKRRALDGEGSGETLVSGVERLGGLAVDGGHLYWSYPGETSDAISRAELAGGDVEQSWIAGIAAGTGVAVDARLTPPPLDLPGRAIRFILKVAEYNLRAGAARVGVYVPGEGDLRVTSPGLSWKVLRNVLPPPDVTNTNLWQVRFRAGTGAVGRRIRTQLRRRGWAKVTLHLEYTLPRTYPVTAQRRFVLRRYPGASAAWVKHPTPPSRRR